MELKPWKKISTEIKFKNPWWTYLVEKYELPSGREGTYHSVHTSGSAFIIPVTKGGKLLLVNQYRFLNDRLSIEFPGGGIKEGEEPESIAHKELIEETGFDGELEKIGIFNPYNGVTNEICHVYIARDLKSSNDHAKDDSEEFELIELTVSGVREKINSNEIYDGMTLASWALAEKYLAEQPG
jgi:ADP-ribose pyrophosphatase